MKLEVLFPEFCNLYGDMWNIKYLEKCSDEVQVVRTPLTEVPAFVTEDIDMIYMGPMTEKTQAKVISKLMEYKDRIKELIEAGKIFLFTGNAFEIFGKYIECDEGKIEGLGIFDIYSKRYMLDRYAGLILGEFCDMKLVGFKNQFSHSFGNNEDIYFVNVEKGIGLNKESKLEGIHYKNFIGTYILGPLFILNADFAKYILELGGVKNYHLEFEEEIQNVHKTRLEDFERLTF